MIVELRWRTVAGPKHPGQRGGMQWDSPAAGEGGQILSDKGRKKGGISGI